MNNDPYFDLPEVSNSDLTALKNDFKPQPDLEEIFRFGTLVDSLITEPYKVNLFKRSCSGYVYTPDEIQLAQDMHKAFMRDEFCRTIHGLATKQKVSRVQNFKVTLGEFTFHLVPGARGKWDLFVETTDMSAEIKTTACTTLKSFIESIYYFDYHRQGSLYLDLEGRSNHMIIGISKKNLQIFKVPFQRSGSMYLEGKLAYSELAFKWWSMFAHWPQPEVDLLKSKIPVYD